MTAEKATWCFLVAFYVSRSNSMLYSLRPLSRRLSPKKYRRQISEHLGDRSLVKQLSSNRSMPQ